jgi:hypothetical protein
MNNHLPKYPPGEPARRRAAPHDAVRATFETSSPSPIRSSSSSIKQQAELSQLREMEALVRELMDRVELPQVWNNRVSKQLRNVEKSRAHA